MIVSDYSKEELIKLANKFLNEENEEKQNELYLELNSHFSHPDVANLFFWPENYNPRKDLHMISTYNPSVEEVIQKGINHRSNIIYL
jgi:ABC-type transport system substrate-binding protein